jgi:hypothetical protein
LCRKKQRACSRGHAGISLKMAQVLLDIAQNASIRGMRVDGVDLFSVLDFVMYVCPGHNCKYATQMWNRLISNDSLKSQKSQNETFAIPEFQRVNIVHFGYE